MNHTKEPWVFHEQGDANEFCLLTETNGWVIAFRQNGEMHTEQQRANARRIVACVNACVGLTTAMLENIALTGGIVERFALLSQTEHQRDELLAAARNLRDVKGRHHSEQAFARLVEAVAKVEKRDAP